MVKWLWAKLTGGKLVWLRDMDGEVTLSIARRDPWGDLSAKRYWPSHIRTVRLLPDGKVDGRYVKEWKDA
jgi:hypothetical protein